MAMWDIGMLLPDANNRIHTSACRVSPQRAICRYVVAVDGKRPCEATGVLTRSYYRFPARTWGCPQAWRPVLAEIPQLHDPASKAIYLGR